MTGGPGPSLASLVTGVLLWLVWSAIKHMAMQLIADVDRLPPPTDSRRRGTAARDRVELGVKRSKVKVTGLQSAKERLGLA